MLFLYRLSTITFILLSYALHGSNTLSYADAINVKNVKVLYLPPMADIKVMPHPVPHGVNPTFCIYRVLPEIKTFGFQLAKYTGMSNNPLDPANTVLSTANVLGYGDYTLITSSVKCIQYGKGYLKRFPSPQIPIGRYEFQIFSKDKFGRVRHARIRFMVAPKTDKAKQK